MPEAGIVRGDQPIPAAEGIDEPSELVRGRRKPVQQQHRRRVRRAGLAVEHPNPIHRDEPMGHPRDVQPFHLTRLFLSRFLRRSSAG
ncbi:MAG: hypothetical protein ACRERE_43630 [Candidatus Entotheonellia bacterium]